MVQKFQTTTWDVSNPVNNGINYQLQVGSLVSSINSRTLTCFHLQCSRPYTEQLWALGLHVHTAICAFGYVKRPEQPVLGGWTTTSRLRAIIKWDPFVGIKIHKCMVVLKDYGWNNSALLCLVLVWNEKLTPFGEFCPNLFLLFGCFMLDRMVTIIAPFAWLLFICFAGYVYCWT